LTVTAGVDVYLPSDLHGHGTTYSPDDENVKSRMDYDYADAHRTINQPGLEMKLAGGVTHGFGR
jgi:hypothetical protein